MKKFTEEERKEIVEKAMQRLYKKIERAQAWQAKHPGVFQSVEEYQEYKRKIHPEYYLEPTYGNVMRVYERVKRMSKTEYMFFRWHTKFNHVMHYLSDWLEMRGI